MTCFSVISVMFLARKLRIFTQSVDNINRFRFSTSTVRDQQAKEVPVFQYATDKTKRVVRVYLWGHALPGCLGNPEYVRPPKGRKRQKTEHKPVKLAFAENYKVSDVACGHGFTLLAVHSHRTEEKLFGTGLNSDGQIGYHAPQKDHPLAMLLQPVPIKLPFLPSTKIISVSCGRTHTVFVTDREGVYSLGSNEFGQCGYPIIEGEMYSHKKRLNKVRIMKDNIVKVFCGQDHSVFLSSEGELFSCGWGVDGQTGLGHYGSQAYPVQLEGDIKGEKIIHVSGVSDTMLAVSEKGDLFGWGNSEYGQLRSVTAAEQLNIPKHLPMPRVGKIIHAAAGGSMCAVVNEKGQVYVWGYGILGKGPQVTHLDEPALLPEPLFGKNEFNPDCVVKSVYCGLSYFVAITNRGHLYAWGRNRKACLGLGHGNDQFFPFRVSVPAEVLKISCGVDHLGALCRAFC